MLGGKNLPFRVAPLCYNGSGMHDTGNKIEMKAFLSTIALEFEPTELYSWLLTDNGYRGRHVIFNFIIQNFIRISTKKLTKNLFAFLFLAQLCSQVQEKFFFVLKSRKYFKIFQKILMMWQSKLFRIRFRETIRNLSQNKFCFVILP